MAENMLSINPINRYSSVKLCLLVFILDILITVLFSIVLFPEDKYGNNIKISSIYEKVLILVMLAPVFETYIFQKLFLEGAVMLTKEKIISSIMVAILFGLAHWYSIPYIIKAFFAGLLYNLLYLKIRDRQQNAFWYVAITHMSFNLFALIISESI
jgi:hypothetical protein